jgi:hypothetical protein
MAQSSSTISSQKTFKSAITVSEDATFTATGGVNKIERFNHYHRNYKQ